MKDESALFGLPSLSKIGSSNDAKKMKLNAGNGRKISGKHIHTQHGMFLGSIPLQSLLC